MGLAAWNRKRDRELCVVGCQAELPFQKHKLHRRQQENSCQKEFTSAVELARYGYTDPCIGCQNTKLGLKPADHSEECLSRNVRHITADADLSQRAQVAQQRIVDTVPSEAQARERDSVSEPPRKKVRFAEQVEEQTLEDTATTIPQNPSSSSTTFASSMQVDESDQDRSKRQKIMHGTDMELEGVVMEAEFDRFQR